jgi:hypothetical protein
MRIEDREAHGRETLLQSLEGSRILASGSCMRTNRTTGPYIQQVFFRSRVCSALLINGRSFVNPSWIEYRGINVVNCTISCTESVCTMAGCLSFSEVKTLGLCERTDRSPERGSD